MPVADGPARALDKGLFKFKKKRPSRCMELLVCGMLVMMTSDTVTFFMDCVQSCPVRMCPVSSERSEQSTQSFALKNKVCENGILEDSPINTMNNELSHAASLGKDYVTTQWSEFTPELQSVGWDKRKEGTDATKQKNGTMYEGVSVFITRFLHDYALYKDQDAADILTPNEIAFNLKATFDSILYVWSF